ncbi:pore-forming ESAT-6 family protein [Paracoccus nototheniae]|uniref:Pore-forming ESAT-6 family protein n=1 Tax=Paracoccus nototheniae TaxID=2489002 RepID=A0ABW4DPV2_9RHOB|nr:pore-forming ESAT-6 family protein [Paracoccus nototheniae]
MIRNIAFALGLGLLPAAALAQDATAPAPAPAPSDAQAATPEAAPDAPAMAPADTETTYQAARNQLGILQYCQEQGFSGAEAIEAQSQLIAMLPAGDETAGAAAEEKGAEGMVAVGGNELSLADAVAGQGATVESTCQQIEAAVNEIAPTLPAG